MFVIIRSARLRNFEVEGHEIWLRKSWAEKIIVFVSEWHVEPSAAGLLKIAFVIMLVCRKIIQIVFILLNLSLMERTINARPSCPASQHEFEEAGRGVLFMNAYSEI